MTIAVQRRCQVAGLHKRGQSPFFHPHPPRAFTLVEALVTISLAAVAGCALLLGTSASLQTTDEALRQTLAQGMAQQLIDEVVGGRYAAVGAGPQQYPLGPNAAEAAGDRYFYDDIDDFNGFSSQPATDPYGVELGTEDGEGGQREAAFRCRDGFFQHWRQEIEVYYVSESDPTVRLPEGQRSDYRAVEVRLIYDPPDRGPRELANIRRVVAYVPSLSLE
ncbi:MAG: type II secretion system protein [Pirellulales bacterium]|nr:type II secretion system protein [Pirellulales bacterium]